MFVKKEKNILLILGVGLLGRILLSRFGSLMLDINTYISWAKTLSDNGFYGFYDAWSDYLPGYLYVLYILGHVNKVGFINEILLFKLPAILSDLGVAYFIYRIVKNNYSEKIARILCVMYVINPAVIYNSTLWGQTDSLVSFFAISSLYYLEKHKDVSAILLAFGTLVKPQTAFLTPLILLKIKNEKWKRIEVIRYGTIGGLFFIASFIPFWNSGNLIDFIISRLGVGLGQYPYTSVNAFNAWTLYGMWESDVGLVSKKLIGFLAAGLIVGGYGLYFQRKKLYKKEVNYYRFGAIIFLASFLFMTRMHERHMYPAFAFLIISGANNFYILLVYMFLSISYSLNLYYSQVWIVENFKEVFKSNLINIISIFNVLSLGVLFLSKSSLDKFIKGFWESERIKFRKDVVSKKSYRYILIGILLFAFLTRIWGLSNPEHEYFDEVYHAFTARQMLNGNPKAWEWWNSAPEGFAYEWTHPPFAKEGMVFGMMLLGEQAYGWRMPAVFMGIGIIYLTYLLTLELFKDERAAILAASVLMLDGLVLVMSRIGMNDIYFVFFMLLSLYLNLKKKHYYSALSIGFASASKWSVFWFIPVLFVTQILLRRKLGIKVVYYLFIPILIYVLSYSPMIMSGHSWNQFIEVQKQMWWYHTGLEATHSYTSPWWSWPFMIRPIWLYTSGSSSGVVSNIYAMGNPIVFWSGFIGILVSIYLALKERSKELLIVISAYLGFFVSWAVSPRIMFLYHYLPSLPFMAIALGVVLRKYKHFTLAFFMLAILCFIYFYPHWIGAEVDVGLDRSYYWLSSWR